MKHDVDQVLEQTIYRFRVKRMLHRLNVRSISRLLVPLHDLFD